MLDFPIRPEVQRAAERLKPSEAEAAEHSSPLEKKASPDKISAKESVSDTGYGHGIHDAFQGTAGVKNDPVIEQKLSKLRDANFSDAEIKKCSKIMHDQQRMSAVTLSDKQVDDLVESHYNDVKQQPEQGKQFHLILGNSGAGKSHFIADKLVNNAKARLLDADEVKPKIDGYNGGLGNQAVHKASTDVMSKLLVKSVNNGDNIVHSMCGTDVASVQKKLDFAKKNGYDVHLHLAEIPAEVSARRVFERGFNAPETQPIRQMIPPSYALEVGNKPVNVFNQIKQRVNEDPPYLSSYSHLNTNVGKTDEAEVVDEWPSDSAGT